MGADKCYFKLKNMSEFKVKYTAILDFGFNYTDVDNVYYDLTLRSYKGKSSELCRFKLNLVNGDRVFVYDIYETFSCFEEFYYFLKRCKEKKVNAIFAKQHMVNKSFDLSTLKGCENLVISKRMFKQRDKETADLIPDEDFPPNFAIVENSLTNTGLLPKDYRKLTGVTGKELMRFYEMLCC